MTVIDFNTPIIYDIANMTSDGESYTMVSPDDDGEPENTIHVFAWKFPDMD